MVRSVQLGLSSPPARILDLGTGGGVPGLLVALSYPSAKVTLVEVREIRADFLTRSLRELDLIERVVVDRRRAEAVGRDEDHRFRYDLVTSRSFGPPAVVAECAAPLLADGGLVIVAEPPPDTDAGAAEDRWPSVAIEALGLTDITGPVTPDDEPAPAFAMRLLRRVEPCEQRFPRRTGVPNRKPLW